ncbi:MAG: exodeoxyribonuclease VII large subunit [Betaproteobacteria bacterium]|nr:exodeoxyribonuclease VII large subunit [Betaproteobacteria bacterium]
MSRVFAPRLPGQQAPQWTVSALLRAVSDTLGARFVQVSVAGEISGLTRASSGHWYFNLKDDAAQVRCVMFRGRNQAVSTPPHDGMQVELRAQVSVYEARGDLQLIVDSLRPAGLGALHERFEQLKARLAAEGLFDPARKRQPTPMPRAIAVVTSLQAAALRDVLSALARRAPHVAVVVYAAAVQGADAPRELLAALHRVAERAAIDHIDTLLLVRGGGSIEDLWAFNDEALARALAQFPLPVVCGVGHETDFTIADFVADVRAPTPTAAAELAAAPRSELWADLVLRAQALQRAQARRRRDAQQRLDRAEMALLQMRHRAAAGRARLAPLAHRLQAGVQRALAQREGQLALLRAHLRQGAVRVRGDAAALPAHARRLHASVQQAMERRAGQLRELQRVLDALAPQRTLERGYSIVTDRQQRVLRSVQALRAQPAVNVRMADGELALRIDADEGPAA